MTTTYRWSIIRETDVAPHRTIWTVNVVMEWLLGSRIKKGLPRLEIVQDFLKELGMKPHLVEIIICFTISCHHQWLDLPKGSTTSSTITILIFKVIFHCWKFVEPFQSSFSIKDKTKDDMFGEFQFFAVSQNLNST